MNAWILPEQPYLSLKIDAMRQAIRIAYRDYFGSTRI